MTKNKKMILSLGSLAAVAAPIAAVVACGSGSSNVDDGIHTTINVSGASQVDINTQMQYDGGQKWQRGIGYEGLMELSDVILSAAQLFGWNPLDQNDKFYSPDDQTGSNDLGAGETNIIEIADSEKFHYIVNTIFGGFGGKFLPDGTFHADANAVAGTVETNDVNVFLDGFAPLLLTSSSTGADLKNKLMSFYDKDGAVRTKMITDLKNYTVTKLAEPSHLTGDSIGFIGKGGMDQYGSAINEHVPFPAPKGWYTIPSGPWSGMHYAGAGEGEYEELNSDLGINSTFKSILAGGTKQTINRLGLIKDINNPGKRFISTAFRFSSLYDKVSVFEQDNVGYTGNYKVQPGDKAILIDANGDEQLVDAIGYYKGVLKGTFEKLKIGLSTGNLRLLYNATHPSSQIAISTLIKNMANIDDAFITNLFNKLNQGQTHWAALSAVYTGVKGMTDENRGTKGSGVERFLGIKDTVSSSQLLNSLTTIRDIGGTNVYWNAHNDPDHEVYIGRNTKY